QRGLMVATTFTSIVTTISWFGVNLLGTGLHSYGFTEKGLFSFFLFLAVEMFIVLAAWVVPFAAWRSYDAIQPPTDNQPPDASPSMSPGRAVGLSFPSISMLAPRINPGPSPLLRAGGSTTP